MPEHLDRLADNLASNTSRRGFLARVSGALMAAAGGGAVVRAVVPPGEAGAFHLCGHTYDRLLPAPGRDAPDRLARLPDPGPRRDAGG